MKQIITILSLAFVFIANCSYGKTKPNYIIFYKPYTDSNETNLYNDSIIKYDYKIQYANLKNANVEEDVKRAIAHKDLRIISICGVSYLFPGLDGSYKKGKNGKDIYVPMNVKYKRYLHKHGFKVTLGTSDTHRSNELSLQPVAYNYAKEYNKLILAKQVVRISNSHH